jgi:N-acetyl-anhydromuramoyl-L-alanine amidase
MLWIDGWYRFARRLDSPNFGPRPPDTRIDLVVIHSISLPPENYGSGYVQQFFLNQLDWTTHPYFETIRGQEVSSHFFIERTGRLWQFVSCDDRAWHAGQSTYRDLNNSLKNNCNDFSIGIELEGVPGQTFEDAQYESLASLNAALSQAYPVLDFVGHDQISPGRKDDPGSAFDWLGLRRDLGW